MSERESPASLVERKTLAAQMAEREEKAA